MQSTLKPSYLEESLLQIVTWLGSTYRLFLLSIVCLFWIGNICVSFCFPIRLDLRRIFLAVILNGFIYSGILIFMELHNLTGVNRYSILSLSIYVLRLYFYKRIASEGATETEKPLPETLSLLWFVFNLCMRVCFTCGFLPHLHGLFNMIAFTSICAISTSRTITVYYTQPEFRILRNQLPLIAHLSSLCLSFGREIIPEREFCETILMFAMASVPYVQSKPERHKEPLTENAGEVVEVYSESQDSGTDEMLESSRRIDPAYQRALTVRRIYYLLHGGDPTAAEPMMMDSPEIAPKSHRLNSPS